MFDTQRGAAVAVAVAGLVVTLAASTPPAAASPSYPSHLAIGGSQVTTRVSLSNTGAEANSFSEGSAVSADGRYVAVTSAASNLVLGDTNDLSDIFVRDRGTGTTTRVSVSSTGAENPNDHFLAETFTPSISADGRYVAFASQGYGLVPADTNRQYDVFVHDRRKHTTSRVSVTSSGAQASGHSPAISADGRYVAFVSFAPNLTPGADGGFNNVADVFVHDLRTGTTSPVSVPGGGVAADAGNFQPAISADGRYVAFGSGPPSTTPGDPGVQGDLFVRDRLAGTTSRVSVSSRGVPANGASYRPAISADGRYVAFDSRATNLVPGDTNEQYDVFVRDRHAHTTSRVSVSSTGIQADVTAFRSSISGDGRYVVFDSEATNLVRGDTNYAPDVFARDRWTGTTSRVSVSSTGAEARWDSSYGTVSADGRHVAFASFSDDLVPDDTNSSWDVFVRSSVRSVR